MTKQMGRGTAVQAKHIAIAVAAAFAPSWADAADLPTGGVITQGSGTILTLTPQSMLIEQTSGRMAAKFDSFSIAMPASVTVNQPSSTSVALFRDIGGSPSQIFGALTANGRIFLSNQSGVLFAPTAQVNVGSLFATSLSIREDDFMAGNYRWYNEGAAGAVTNHGTITALSGYAVLAGPQVRNDGIIVAHSGSVVLAAGDRVSLDFIGDRLISVSVDQAALNASAINSGTGSIVADGGTVLLTARSANALLDTVVNAGGVIRATSLAEVNGEIVLDGGSAGTVMVAGAHEAGSASVSGAAITMNGTISTGPGSGTQTVTTPGNLTIQAGSGINENAGLVHLGSGEQKVTAGQLFLMGGNAGSNNRALITSSNAAAHQTIDVANGMQVGGGGGGDNNQAIVQSAGNQTIDVGATLGVEGGAFSGLTGNNTAFIQGATSNAPDKKQIINAGAIIMRSGAGGFQNGAVIVAPRQEITTSGDVIIAAGGTGGQLGGVRMGGTSTGAGGINTTTDLKLKVGNDLLMAGGMNPGNAAVIGSTGTLAQSVLIEAGRDVVLGGQGPSIARIGTGAQGAPGNISLTAGRDLRLNGGGEMVSGGTLSVKAGGAIDVNATAPLAGNARISSNSGQTIDAQSVAVTAQNGRLAQIANTAVGDQRITTTGNVEIQTLGPLGGTAEIRNGSGLQTLDVGGDRLTLRGLGGGAANIASNGDQTIKMAASGPKSITIGDHAAQGLSTISSNGDQKILGYADITITGGSGPVANGSNATIFASNQTRTQRIEARNLSLANSILGGNNSFAGIQGAHQSIHALGNVTLTANASGGTLPGVRIGGLSGAGATATDLVLTVGRDLVLSASNTTANNGVGIGSTAAPGPAFANNITIDAGGNVVVSGGTMDGSGARIGSSGVTGAAPGDINITAGGDIVLNGGTQAAAIRTWDTVTLNAANISEVGLGTIIAGTLNTHSRGSTLLTGMDAAFNINNVVSNFNGVSGGDLTFFNRGPLTVTGVNAAGNASLVNALADLNLTGQWTSSTASIFSGARIVESGAGAIQAASLVADAPLGLNLAGANRVGVLDAKTAGFLTFNNVAALEVARASASNGANLTSAGTLTISGPVLSSSGVDLTANGGSIVQTGTGSITTGFGSLSTSSTGDTTLNGRANQISSFNATSGGDVLLNNLGALSVTGLSAGGDAGVINAGNVTLTGLWSAGGTTHIAAQSDLVLGSLLVSPHVVFEAGGSISEFGQNGVGAVVADTLTTISGGNTFFSGENRVANYNGASGGDLFFFNRGDLNVSGLNASMASLSNNGAVTISGPWITTGHTNITAFGGPGASLSQTPGGFIQAAGFNALSADGSVNLNGPNRISGNLFGHSMQGDFRLTNTGDLSFGAFAFLGDVDLVNAGVLNVSSLSGRNVAVTNAGDMTVSGFWNSNGRTSIATSAGGLTVNSSVISQGAMTVDVDGALTVAASGQIVIPPPPGFPPMPPSPQVASLTSFAGQDISAKSILVSAHDGALALVSNQGTGNQTITVSGGGLEVRASGGLPSGPGSSGAQINNFGSGSQTVAVHGGAGIDILATAGSASINQIAASSQTILVTNAEHISLNGSGGSAFLGANGGAQTVSITGSGANAIALRGFAGIGGGTTQNVMAGAQGENGSISMAGSALNGPTASISTRPSSAGTQTVSTSGLLSITGGSALAGNSTGIFHNGSGEQTVNAARIELQGGAAGNNNGALIVSNSGPQNVDLSGDLIIAGGAGGNAGIVGPANGLQSIHANNIEVSNSDNGGNNSVGFIQGGHQEIDAVGDVTLIARASGGTLPGVRIGGLTNTATDLQLSVGGDLTLQAGSANNGVGIGSTAGGTTAFDNHVTIEVGGDVILNAGTQPGAGARIGSSASTGAGHGHIVIHAGGAIELNGASQAAAIRTLDSVTLTADRIVETGNGLIAASSLSTTTRGDATLTGPNQLSLFTAASDHGSVHLTNSKPVLTLASMDLPGNLTVVQTGDLAVGSASAQQSTAVSAAGDIFMSASDRILVRGSDTTAGASSAVLAGGELQLSAGNVSLIGGSAPGSFAQIKSHGAIDISAGGNVSLTGGSADGAFARILGYSDINLTVGGFITLDAGSGLDSWARVQTASRDSVITLNFPNLTSGGYFVNGIEGLLRDGHSGFLSGNGVAAPEHQLLINYGPQ